jgi:DNA polymerase
LAQSLDPATREALQARLRFYRDLGLTEFYRRPVDESLLAESATDAPDLDSAGLESNALAVNSDSAQLNGAHNLGATSIRPLLGEGVGEHDSPSASTAEPIDRIAALQQIRDEIGDCTRCALHAGRNQIVFGDGSPHARLMFVGEGPGEDEDAQGLPFVGKSGQLLNNMIAAMGLKREEVYIANVVKCRPPGNRVPEQAEGATCTQFLFRQIDVVRPQVLVALGATAATWLLGQRQPLAGLRGRVHAVRGAQVIVTYHPAYLLRDPRQKKEAWADLQIAMRELGLKPPGKG